MNCTNDGDRNFRWRRIFSFVSFGDLFIRTRRLCRRVQFGPKIQKSLNGLLPPADGSVRPQTLGKRVSDDPRHFIFRHQQKMAKKIDKDFRKKKTAENQQTVCLGGAMDFWT